MGEPSCLKILISSAKDLARGLQKYLEQYDTNVWLSAKAESAAWNDKSKEWSVSVDRAGQKVSITACHVVFAIGPGGQIPKMPEYPHREEFGGVVMHSIMYRSSHAWKGKKGVVIGAGNIAHDVADDMLLAGLSNVTMVQRNITCMLPCNLPRQRY